MLRNKCLLVIGLILIFQSQSWSQSDGFLDDPKDPVELSTDSLPEFDFESILKSMVDSMENTVTFLTGEVPIGEGEATIIIPEGYRYLDANDAKYILEEHWGNPPSASLGLLFPPGQSPFSPTMTFAVEVSYSEEGYIEDDDAAEIDYDELLADMQEEAEESKPLLREQGYSGYDLIGWASPPYYDSERKKLHWAKELKFDSTDENTLNYDIRILGRKGYLNMTVIGVVTALPEVNEHIDEILASVEFNEGYKYEEFDSDLDKVAAYGIGGLIAGKVLAKAGLFAVIVKFWKIIAIAVVGFFALMKKKLFGSKEE